MKADEDAVEAAVGGEEGSEGSGGNVTEMEIMENFVRSLVEDWRYQGKRMTGGQTNAAGILS